MNKALFAGVSGLMSNQTRMDVIGNNVSNVSTYGYKSQRAVFADMFYQTLRAASEGTASKGGTNPSTVGLGTSVAGVQSKMSTSSVQSTGYGLDVALSGEGFLQVMDGSGNVYFTKAGLLDYDANGYLIDINGNFVLGAGASDADPNSLKIKLDDLGVVDATPPSITTTINNIEYTISGTNASSYGNFSLNIGSSSVLPAGMDAQATISTTGAVTVLLNDTTTFASMAALNTAINEAILQANGGVEHAAGTITIAAEPDPFMDYTNPANPVPGPGLTGGQIAGAAGGVDIGSWLGADSESLFGLGIKVNGVSTDFNATTPDGTTTTASNISYTEDADGVKTFTLDMTIDGKKYTGSFTDDTQAKSFLLKADDATNADGAAGYIELSMPTSTMIEAFATGTAAGTNVPTTPAITFTASVPSSNLGFGKQSFALIGGTEGGLVELNQLTNISIGVDGIITVTHDSLGVVIAGKISLANFANPGGLQSIGNNYYAKTVNSGEPLLCDPGTNGTGTLVPNSLEMSNVDLSEQFTDMIVCQRGFQASSRIITVTDSMIEELINLKR